MKKITTIKLYALALATIVVSCAKQDTFQYTESDKVVPATIYAEPTDSDTGKTTATWNKDEQKYNITWDEGDALSVFNSKDASMKKFTAISSGQTTKFNGELSEGATPTYAILPYYEKATCEGTEVYTRIPAEQDGSFGNIVLAGKKQESSNVEQGEYDFKYTFEAVSGILKFHFDPSKFTGKLEEGEKIVSVRIVADRPIVGDAQISYAGEKPVMTAGTKNIYNTISLTTPDGLKEGDYYFATLPILVSAQNPTMGITVAVETNKGNTASVTTSLPGSGKTNIFTANIVKNIGTINFAGFNSPFNFTTKATSSGTIWTYTKISFSRGNLQYQGSNNKWRFALNQWDVQGNVGNSTLPKVTEAGAYESEGPRATQSEWIDLFPWGHTNWNDGNRTYEPSQCTSIENKFYYKYYTKPLNGTPGDWGYQNAIINGDKEDVAGTWRVPNGNELEYILYTRGTEQGQTYMPTYTFDVPIWAKTAQLRFLRCGIENSGVVQYGLLIFPDGFKWPSNVDVPLRGGQSLAFNDRYISDSEAPKYTMSIFASSFEGCAFLPSAGYRLSFTPGSLTSLCPQDLNIGGKYWIQEGNAFGIYSQNISLESRAGWYGCSVRLVKDVK